MIAIASLLALTCILGLVGCNSRDLDDKPTFAGIIKEVHADHILIATSTADGYPYGASIDVSISIKECDTIYTPLAVGDEIVVYYDGKMTESNPALVNTVYAITLKTPANKS